MRLKTEKDRFLALHHIMPQPLYWHSSKGGIGHMSKLSENQDNKLKMVQDAIMRVRGMSDETTKKNIGGIQLSIDQWIRQESR